MAVLERDTQVFIVRLWREPREVRGAKLAWRGVVEHIRSGNRRYVNDLAAISAFMVPYLEEMGIQVTSGWRMTRWPRGWRWWPR
jgi:hypothetical protein